MSDKPKLTVVGKEDTKTSFVNKSIRETLDDLYIQESQRREFLLEVAAETIRHGQRTKPESVDLDRTVTIDYVGTMTLREILALDEEEQ